MSDDSGAKELYGKISVGFMGAGMMASAIMDGLISKGVVSGGDQIACSDPYEPALKKASDKGIFATTSNAEVCEKVKDAIIIAVKPHYVVDVCKDIMASSLSDKAVIISVAAGITLSTLESNLPGRKVVRVMPNTPCLVGCAASGFAMGKEAKEKHDQDIVKAIFGSVGIALEMKEDLLNGVTGVSGSGPAYVFEFIEAMADGGVRVGLTRQDALQLAAQTVKGAAEMVLQTGQHPGVLKDQVCSPGGTTIAAVDVLEQGGLRSTMIQTVKAATRRSLVLGGATDEEIAKKFNL